MSRMPENFGKYRVLERLGAGGMAEVYKCRLEGLGGFDKLVVVKTILPDRRNDPGFVEMFLDEARIASNLTHPNVLQIFEVDQLDGVPFIAMEYVRGPTLAALLAAASKKRRLHFGYAAKIIAGMSAGLHYAHSATNASGQSLHIVHRDVSPQNVMISTEGVPKLLDFGVAKARGKLVQTDAGVLKGKLRYMAPELLRGEPASARTDVFAAGVCLYEAVTGEPLFQGLTEAELITTISKGEIRPPSQAFLGCPAKLEQIVLWALHPDPKQRCPSAMDLHEALEDFVASGSYAATTRDVADWMVDLLPAPGAPVSEPPASSLPGNPPTSPTVAAKPVKAAPPAPSEAPPQPAGPAQPAPSYTAVVNTRPPRRPVERNRGLLAVLGAAVAVTALTVGLAQITSAEPAPPAPPKRIVPAPALPPAPEHHAPAALYLDRAEQVMGEHHFDAAQALLDQADRSPDLTPEQRVRWVELSTRVAREGGLARARALQQLGDTAGARAAVLRAIEHDPDPALLAAARELLAPPASRPHRPATTVALSSSPSP